MVGSVSLAKNAHQLSDFNKLAHKQYPNTCPKDKISFGRPLDILWNSLDFSRLLDMCVVRV